VFADLVICQVTGSGKTTLARQISERTGLPWHPVNDLTWQPGWVAVPSGMLTELDASGTVVREVVPEHQPSEHLGAFAVLRDGICASWLPAGRGHVVPPGQHPRVARHGLDGSCRWSAPAVLEQLSYPARVLAGDETGREERLVT
jgi:hypothetical protein